MLTQLGILAIDPHDGLAEGLGHALACPFCGRTLWARSPGKPIRRRELTGQCIDLPAGPIGTDVIGGRLSSPEFPIQFAQAIAIGAPRVVVQPSRWDGARRDMTVAVFEPG